MIAWAGLPMGTATQDLYVEVRVDELVQRTKAVKQNRTVLWNEDILLCALSFAGYR
jgi:hypothetical protein